MPPSPDVTQPAQHEAGAFASPAAFMAIPRLSGLLCSPTGDLLVAAVAQIDAEGAKFVTSLYALDPAGELPARRLTRSGEGESAMAFLPGGDLLFTSARPRPARSGSGEQDVPEDAALWLLPAGGGEPFVVLRKPGGVVSVASARDATTVVIGARSAPGSLEAPAEREWWSQRRTKKVSATLYDGLPVRHWDHYLGPSEIHLYALDLGSEPAAELDAPAAQDLTLDAGQALHDSHHVLSPDGTLVVTDWTVRLPGGRVRSEVVAIEVATGQRRAIAASEDGSFDYGQPAISPDGRSVVTCRTSRATIGQPSVVDLWLVDLESGSGRALELGDGPYVQSARFAADGSALLVATDCGGRGPLYRLDLGTGEAVRLTGEGHFSSIEVAQDGSALFALRSSVGEPPRPVRLGLEATAPGEQGALSFLDAPGAKDVPSGRVEEVQAEAADGSALRAWLVLPDTTGEAAPAPLAVFVHGGPLGSWNGWHWRWNPWLLAAHGWAVLLPDPALSTGYGQKMIKRGWGQWGGAPYDDVMALTDAALGRSDLDASRTAALGGSYGGYMANWIAGHTTRFQAIVSHASLWSLEQFLGTTDWPGYWADEWGYPDTNPELYERWSPDRYAGAIRTPMLVTHGDRDYRCPVGESLRLWTELTRRGVPSKFLFFAEENHWILRPADGIVWYETVLAFLAEHVLGQPFERPALL